MDIRQKCEIVAANFHWWATTATKYLEEDSWTDGRVRFIEERFSIYERVNSNLESGDYKLVIPGDVKLASHPLQFRVRLSVAVTGFRSKEYVHLLSPCDRLENLFLYRTKTKSLSLPQSATVSGVLQFHADKTLFAGYEFPTVRKASLKVLEVVE